MSSITLIIEVDDRVLHTDRDGPRTVLDLALDELVECGNTVLARYDGQVVDWVIRR